jgi:hypothetical protein
MAAQKDSFDTFLQKINISEKGRKFLIQQEFDEGILKTLTNKNINTELKDEEFTLAKGDRTRLKTWIKSLPETKKRSKSPHSKTKKNSPNVSPPRESPVRNSPRGSPGYRQTSVSEELLQDIVNDPGQRRLMDDLMKNGMEDILYEGKQVFLHRHTKNGFYSDLKQRGESIYYRWNIERDDGTIAEAFHLSLNHTKNERHANRAGHNRNIVGALHVRFGTGKRNFRRVLINLIDGVYELTVCVKKTPYNDELDPFAKRIIQILVEYYNKSGKEAKTMYDNGRGPIRGISRC